MCPEPHLTFNTSNRIADAGYQYDAAGNLTQKPNPGGLTMEYDAENRMTSAAGVRYSYDGDGKRVQQSNGRLYWYGAGSEALLETDAAGNNPTEYVFFNGKRIARRDSATVSYFFADHLGSSRVVTNASRAILEDSDFYPFGGERIIVDMLTDQNYKFTGKERDSESGLDYFGARHYGSSIGRFLQADTPLADQDASDPRSWNLYSYTRNNPLRYVDDDGKGVKEGVLNWIDRTGFAFARAVLEPDKVVREIYSGAKELN